MMIVTATTIEIASLLITNTPRVQSIDCRRTHALTTKESIDYRSILVPTTKVATDNRIILVIMIKLAAKGFLNTLANTTEVASIGFRNIVDLTTDLRTILVLKILIHVLMIEVPITIRDHRTTNEITAMIIIGLVTTRSIIVITRIVIGRPAKALNVVH